MVEGRKALEGYKMTEAGVIPEDWEEVKLGEVSSYITKGSTPTTYGFNWEDSGVLFFKSDCVNNGRFNYGDYKFISIDAHDLMARSKIYKKDLLITITGNLGKVCVVPDYIEEANINQHIAIIRVVNIQMDYRFIYHWLNQQKIRDYYNQIKTGLAYPQISLVQVRNTIIPKPPISEQKAIAEALSDTDNLILSLEKLIDKKKKIKQGAMQQLLTGKKQLPGFSGEWEVKKLGEIADVYQPKTISESDFTEDGYLVYGANGIVGRYSFYNHEKWQVTITCRGSTCGTVNKTREKSWITGNAMVVNLDNNNKVSKMFIYYFLRSYDFKNYITGSGQPQIVRGPLLTLEIKLPTVEEQKAIAQVLSDMDAEIEALEEKLEKVKTIKQGMMQELLTGRIRLT
jgi:type I restriction enzyme S subunit